MTSTTTRKRPSGAQSARRRSARPRRVYGHTVPRVFTPPRRKLTPQTSAGYAAVHFAMWLHVQLAGTRFAELAPKLNPWQRWFLIHALELNPDGSYRFKTVLLWVARQNGKTFIAALLILFRMFVDGDAQIIGVAQKLATAKKTWEHAQNIIDAIPRLQQERGGFSNTNGELWFELTGGQRYWVDSADNGGRGLTFDLVFVDEILTHKTFKAWSALSKTTAARRRSQLIAASNAGDMEAIVQRHLHKMAMDAIESGDTETTIGLFWWSPPPRMPLDSPEAWAYSNPSMNYNLPQENLAAYWVSDPAPVFASEVGNVFVDSATGGPFQPGKWAAGFDRLSKRADGAPVYICIEVSHNREMAYIGFAAERADGAAHVGIMAKAPGTDWIIPWLTSPDRTFTPAAITFQTNGAPSAQAGQPNASMKGLNIGHIFDSRFEDIEILNSWATAFGLDFLVNVVIENCGATGAGRGVNKESLLGFGSGFGIGTGAYANESMFLRNIRTKGSGRMGINLEWLHEYGQYFDTQIFVDGWHSDGDAVGVGDLGNGGLHLYNALIEYFTAAAIVIGPGGQAPQGGRRGHIDKSVRIRKGAKTAANTPDQDIYGANGIVLRGDGAGGYNIEATVENIEGAALLAEPGFRLTPGGLRVAMQVFRAAKGVDWRAGGRMEPDVIFEDGHYEDSGIGLDLRTSLLAPGIHRNTFRSTDGKQPIAVRFDPAMPVVKGVVSENVTIDTATFIDGRGTQVELVERDNRVVSTTTDASIVFFDQMTAFPDVSSIGDGWMAATKGAFTQSHVWGRGRYGAQPKPGGTGNSGAGIRYRDCGGLGYSISAWIDPPSTGIGRRGIVASYDPDTGVCIVFENSSTVYQVARYDASGNRTVVASTSVPTSTRAHIEIRQSATGNSFWFYLNGELIRDVFNTSTVPKTRYAGMFGLASADAWINALAIRPIAA